MPRRLAVYARPPVRFAAVWVAALICSAARGQGEDVLPLSGMDSLNNEYRKHRDLANDLIRGFKAADTSIAAHVEALDILAKYDTYRFTWIPEQQKPDAIAAVYRGGVDTTVPYLLKARPRPAAAIEIYGDKVTEHALEVLKTRKLIARVNAARVLAKLAELGSPKLSDALVSVLDDPEQNIAVKCYAAKGLGVLAAFQPAVMTPEREKKAADSLASFIEHPMTLTATTTPEEVEGYRYVRREAIRALAQFHNPAASEKGHGALALLRVVAKDGLVPTPRIDERVEAAIGVARLRASLDKEYNLDYALAQIGLFMEDFTLASTRAKEAQQEGGKATKAAEVFPWKILAARQYDAIEQMRSEAGDSPESVKLAGECLKLLGQLEKGNAGDPEAILRLVAARQQPGRLFKNVEDSTVKPANRREDGAPGTPQLQTQPAPPPPRPGPAPKK
jgi:hypothetical protein